MVLLKSMSKEQLQSRSRRHFLKILGLGGILTGTSVAEHALLPHNAKNRLLRLYQVAEKLSSQLFSTNEQLFTNLQEKRELYATYQQLMDIPQATWLEGKVAEGLEKASVYYFEQPLAVVLPQCLELMQVVQVDPRFALPVMAHWGDYKIASPRKVIQEDVVAATQSAAYAATETIERTGVPLRDFIARRLRSMVKVVLAGHGDADFLVQKATISTRTVGFYDKESILYAQAAQDLVSAKIIEPQTLDMITWSGFFQQAQELLAAQLAMYAERVTTNQPNGTAHQHFATLSRQIEYQMTKDKKNVQLGLATTLVIIKQGELVIKELLQEKVDFTDLTDGQYLLVVFLSLNGADYIFGAKTRYNDPKQQFINLPYTLTYDPMIDVRLDIPEAYADVERALTTLGYNWKTITVDQVIEVLELVRSGKHPNLSPHKFRFFYPYIDMIKQLATKKYVFTQK
jgi:hypothetical protein